MLPINQEIQQEKEHVASSYISAWKKELSDGEQKIISTIEERMKAALLSDDVSRTEILKEFKTMLSDAMIDKIALFLEEKKNILEKANTIDDLKKLKEDIATQPYIQNPLNTLKAGAVGLTADIIKSRSINALKEKPIDPEAIKQSINDITKKIEFRLKEEKELASFEKKQMKKLIKEFKQMPDYIWSSDALAKWKTLVDEKILPVDLLRKINLSNNAIESLKLIQSEWLAAELVGKKIDEIKVVLSQKGITNLSDDVLEMISKGTTTSHVDDIIHVLSSTTKLSWFTKILNKIPLIDVAIMWYQTYEYGNGSQNEKETAQYALTMTTGLIGACAPFVFAGPVGWLVIWWAIVVDIVGGKMIDNYHNIKKIFLYTLHTRSILHVCCALLAWCQPRRTPLHHFLLRLNNTKLKYIA